MGIGTQIKKYRLQAGWTLERLSEVSGVEIGTIGALEARDSSRSKYFPAIAKALGMTVEELADVNATHRIMVIDGNVVSPAHIAREPGVHYLWPFKDIKPHEWELLTDTEKQHFENGVLLLIQARASPKHEVPAKTTTSA